MATAWSRIQQAYRQSTYSAHRTHLRTFLSFLYSSNLPFIFTLSSGLAFLEYLYQNHISPKVIKNYLSSITTMASSTTRTFFIQQWPDISEAFPSILGFNPPLGTSLMSKYCMLSQYPVISSLTLLYLGPFSYHPSMPFCACPM